MSKSTRKTDASQPNQFDILTKISSLQEETTEGQLNIIDQLRRSLRTAIKSSSFSRHQIAGQMSHLLGRTITKEMLDSWTREDQELPPSPQPSTIQGEIRWSSPTGEELPCDKPKKISRHIPAEYLPAFCKATGSSEPLRVLGEAVGLFVAPGEEAMRAEIHKLDEQIRDTQAKKKKWSLVLNEMKGRKAGH